MSKYIYQGEIMPGIVRRGDVNSAGGRAVAGQANFKVNNKGAVTVGTRVGRHRPCPRVSIHCNASTSGGVSTFIINGKAANIIGNSDSCGHGRQTGSPDFIIGN